MKIKCWPTFRIKAVLDDPYYRGIDGKDYEDIKDELQNELYERENKAMERTIKNESNKDQANEVEDIPTIRRPIMPNFADVQKEQDRLHAEAMAEGNAIIQRLEDEIELEALHIYSDQLKEQAEAMAEKDDIFACLDDLIGIRGKFELCNELILKREL